MKAKIIYIIIFLLMSSCSYLFIGPAPSNFKYQVKNYKLQSNYLKTNGFYYYKSIQLDKIYYNYLRFYDNGQVNHTLTTAYPKDIKMDFLLSNDVYGYFRLDAAIIAYELKSHYGYYELAEGTIMGDTLNLKMYSKSKNPKKESTYFRKYCFYKF